MIAANNYFEVVGSEDECAKHGKEHMAHLKNLIVMADGTEHIIRKRTWVCRACMGEEYFKELSEAQDE